MEYVIELLERDKSHLEKCLGDFTEAQQEEYKESFKLRNKRLKEISKAIEVLKRQDKTAKLLKDAYNLVGHPGTGVSAACDIACDELRQSIQDELKNEIYGLGS